MKLIKYFGIAIAVIGMIYAKNQIDARNKSDIQTIESLDQDDGAPAPATKTKKQTSPSN